MKFLGLILAVLIGAQLVTPQAPNPVKTATTAAVVSSTGRFRITLPNPSEIEGSHRSETATDKQFTTTTDTWNFQAISISVTRITKSTRSRITAAERSVISTQAKLKITHGGKDKLISDFPIKLGKFTGRQMIKYLPYIPTVREILAHTFVSDSEAFVVKAEYQPGYDINKLAFVTIASFRIDGEPDELALNLPNTLPQYPPDHRQGTDAKDNGLNGAVQTVREYHEFASGNGGKQIFSESNYSRMGNLERSVFYNDMLPLMVEDYGYLNRRRVFKDRPLIQYNYRKTPGTKYVTKHIARNGDRRYKKEYAYLYDDRGRLNEVNIWDSSRVWQGQEIASYSGNTVTWRTYGLGHKLTSRKILVSDENGNVVKEAYFGPKELEPTFSTTYTYMDFDKMGNWTKRSARTALSGVENVESVEYRSHTYY